MKPSRLSLVVRYAILIVATLLTVGPLIWMVGKSLGTSSEVYDPALRFWPESLSFDGFKSAWNNVPFLRYTLNSIFAATTSALVSIVLCVPAGYGFARYKFPARGLAFMAVMSTMMIPVTIIAIPLYLESRALGLINNYAGLVIPTALWPLGVYVMRQAFQAVDENYFEAGRLDGAGELQIFLRIALPQVRTPVIVVGLYAFIQNWNSYLWPLIAVQRDSMRPLPTGLDAFQASVFGNYEYLLAAGTMATVPTLMLFAFLQRYFVQATFTAGIKG